MVLFTHEIRQGIKMLLIWSVAVSAIIIACMACFPEVEAQAEEIREAFATMGAFTSAFGLDIIDMTDPLGFYGLDCAAVLAFGGGIYASYLGARMLAKEEAEKTSEFLLPHPRSRTAIIAAKLSAVFSLVLAFNAICTIAAVASFLLIDKEIPIKAFALFQLAQLLLHLEIAGIAFGVSALLGRGSAGFGVGFAALLYFLNIAANISDKWSFLRYITPFSYADPANVIPNVEINSKYLLFGVVYTLLGVLFAFYWYTRKDIAV